MKQPVCELCGQGELWRGRRMGMILDHINGVSDDNRIENLRIVCPNCAATLDTHCGRKLRLAQRECLLCGAVFQPRYKEHRYCSTWCGQRNDRSRLRGPRPEAWKVERPPYDQFLAEIQAMGYCTVGRKYGVSDNAIRNGFAPTGRSCGRLRDRAQPGRFRAARYFPRRTAAIAGRAGSNGGRRPLQSSVIA